MEFRRATAGGLVCIREMFSHLVQHMKRDGIHIWDDVYPNEVLAEDVELGRLYVLLDGGTAVSAFALCEDCSGQGAVDWRDNDARAWYLFRLGVNVDYLRRGIGGVMIGKAVELTRELGGQYLRLFVVDCNKPAIDMYLKYGFWQVEGAYDQVIDGRELHEFGFEINA